MEAQKKKMLICQREDVTRVHGAYIEGWWGLCHALAMFLFPTLALEICLKLMVY